MSKLITFFLNGQEYYTDDAISLFDLLNYFDYTSSLLVLEYNDFVCNRKNWDQIIVKENDKIEIVTIVGGG